MRIYVHLWTLAFSFEVKSPRLAAFQKLITIHQLS